MNLKIINAHIGDAHCDFCKDELSEQCKTEHPEYLTPKKKEIKLGKYPDIERYVNERISYVPCLILEDWEDYENDKYICKRHLLEIVAMVP